MLTMAPELRPYSALNVELSTLNCETVLIEGWKVIWFWTMSFRLTPFTMKFTVSSRLPAELNANDPCPRSGAVRNPACGGVTDPGMSSPRSTKCRPLSGMSWTVRWLMTCPTEIVDDSMTGVSATTVTASATVPTPSWKSTETVRATASSTSFAWGLKPLSLASTWYKPGASDARRYWPAASETAVRSTPVAFDRATIETPGTMAPCSSVTSPCSVAVDWAAAADASSQTKSVHATWAANALQLLPLIDSLILHLLLSGDRTTQPAWGDAVVRDAKPGPSGARLKNREKTVTGGRSGTASEAREERRVGSPARSPSSIPASGASSTASRGPQAGPSRPGGGRCP